MPVVVPAGQTEGAYLLGAARNAAAGAHQITLTAMTGSARRGYQDGDGRTYVASQPFKLSVAEPHVEARIPRTSIERGKTATLTVKLNHLQPIEGKAKVTLARLPRGVDNGLHGRRDRLAPSPADGTGRLRGGGAALTTPVVRWRRPQSLTTRCRVRRPCRRHRAGSPRPLRAAGRAGARAARPV